MIKRRSHSAAKPFFHSGKRRAHGLRWDVDDHSSHRPRAVRYAVVGLGYIAQVAVLPAFKHAENSELTALISSDITKLRELTRRYRVRLHGTYEDYDALLRSGRIDAVYIAEPNSLHLDFALRAAEAGIHVLCEKPLALTVRDCQRMIDACKGAGVKLMTAYRLHFEKSNLETIRILRSGKIGNLRFFNSTFSMQVRPGNIRLQKKLGGGPLYDLGVYCINAARYLFQSEPIEVQALTASGKERRFREVEEMAGAVLRFPDDRLATFMCSFGAADIARYLIVGTKGSLELVNGYEYSLPVELHLTVDGKKASRTFPRRDQFAPELVHFSDCILKDKEPEPSGLEGLNDVRVIRAIFESAEKNSAVKIDSASRKKRPSPRQEMRRRAVKKPKLVKAKSGSLK